MSELLVKLQIYEGPLDLLLHLIKKNEVDLDDIPVALITAQYLNYLDLMESLNVELAADFLVMAATLTQIKSRLLLPREDDDLESDPAEDLKAAIIDPLMERLKRGFSDYRDAAEALRHRQVLDSDVFVRGGAALLTLEDDPSIVEEDLAAATLFDLIDAFLSLTQKKPEIPTLNFVVEPKTIAERIDEIQGFLKAKKRVTFVEICGMNQNQGERVLSFLAVLELARTGFLRLYQNLAQSAEMILFLANPDAEAGQPEESFAY